MRLLGRNGRSRTRPRLDEARRFKAKRDFHVSLSPRTYGENPFNPFFNSESLHCISLPEYNTHLKNGS